MARPDILVQVPKISKDLWERLIREPSDVLLISQSLLHDTPKSRITELQIQPDSPAIVVLTDKDDSKIQAHFLTLGCDAVLFTGLAIEQVRDIIEAMLEKRRRSTQRRFFAPLPLAEPRLADFVSRSPGMADFMNLVPRVVRSDTSLVIEGETGVGKERLACAIHAEGPRSNGRFVALNCGALPEHLLESELFGHVRGAFTGATTARRGWFEIAHNGTLFLDEVGEIPIHLQVKLLRVLQEHEIQPVGSEKSFGVDVRVIAASNRHLAIEADEGRFRRDLYHRLSVVTVIIPPLRERSEDIPTLVHRHLFFLAEQMHRHVTSITDEAVLAMSRYSWPGNVRELNNVIERAILLCDDTKIMLEDLPQSIAAPTSKHSARHRSVRGADRPSELQPTPTEMQLESADSFTLPEKWLSMPMLEFRNQFVSDLERQYVMGLLKATHGRIGAAAKRAGIPERSLYEKIQQFGLHKEDFKPVADSRHMEQTIEAVTGSRKGKRPPQ